MSNAIAYRLPQDWKESELQNLIATDSKITYGVVQPGKEDPSGVPFIRGGDIFNGKINIGNLRTISTEVSNSYKRTLLHGGELVMSLVGYPGEVAIVPSSLAGANIARQAAFIKLRNNLHNRYVMYYLLSDIGKYFLFQKSTGSAQQVINLIDLKEVIVLLPPLQEQQKIASILTSVDEVIEKTEAQISKLQDLKKGMMQELLTKGIGHTEFKDSPIGRIPKGWDVATIGDIATKVGSGITPRGGSKVYQKHGIKFIRSQNVFFWGLDLSDVAYLTQEIHDSMSTTRLEEGDVLLNITGASLGRCTFVPQGFGEGNVNQHVCIIRPDKTTDTRYLAYWLGSEKGQNYIFTYQAGGNREGLNFQQIRSIPLPLPSVGEQQKISQSLAVVDDRLQSGLSKVQHLRSLKAALMQDLLTGKVRVKVN